MGGCNFETTGSDKDVRTIASLLEAQEDEVIGLDEQGFQKHKIIH